MSDIINLNNLLSDMYGDEIKSSSAIYQNIEDFKKRINDMEEKLSHLNNYQHDFDGLDNYYGRLEDTRKEIFDINEIVENEKMQIDYLKEVVGLADEEIERLSSAIDSVDKQIEEMLDNPDKVSEIRNLLKEKVNLENLLKKEYDDKNYFLNEINSLKTSINEKEQQLKELNLSQLMINMDIEDKSFNSELYNQDQKELDNLYQELNSATKYFDQIIAIKDLMDVLNKIENHQIYNESDIQLILEKIKDLQNSDEKIDLFKNLITEKKKDIEILSEKIEDLNNYSFDNSNYEKRQSKLNELIALNVKEADYNDQLINDMEQTKEKALKNKEKQTRLIKQIEEINLDIANATTKEDRDFYQEQLKEFEHELGILKEEENNLVAIDYESKLQDLNKRKEEYDHKLLVIEKIKKSNVKKVGYKRFELNNDQAKLTLLKQDLRKLETRLDNTTNLSEYINSVLQNYKNSEDEKLYEKISNNVNEVKRNKKDNQDYEGEFEPISSSSELNLSPRVKTFGGLVIKLKKPRKASKWENIKHTIKKNIKKIVAGVLVGAVLIADAFVFASNKDIKNVNYDINLETQAEMQLDSNDDYDINDLVMDPTETQKSTETETELIMENVTDSIKENNPDDKKDSSESIKITASIFNIGDSVKVKNDLIYVNSIDAKSNINGLPSTYGASDERKISAINLVNADGDSVVITADNQDQMLELIDLGYKVESYCTSNETQGILYEGWHNINDLEVSYENIRHR